MGINRAISKNSRLCSIHFSQNCFRPAYVSGNPRLISGAIPTIRTLAEFVELETVGDEESIEAIEGNENDENTEFETLGENSISDFEPVEEFSPDENR